MKDPWLIGTSLFLIVFSILILRSISPSLFPIYFVYLVLGVLVFMVFSKIGFDIWTIFDKHFYVASVIFLALPLLIGEVTRGAVRWLQVGALTVQPAEIVRPFLILFFAQFFYEEEVTIKRIVLGLILFLLPFFLIVVQPSLGVAILTAIGFLGVILASPINKRNLVITILVFALALPSGWFFLAPYQRERVAVLFDPNRDPFGAGYNSIQSMIAVGSGKIFGRGLGEGIQTQLKFLPERHTDFIFASISEELGFIGAVLILLGIFLVLYRIVLVVENAKTPQGRALASGVFLSLFAQTLVHIGMNMGIFPITGIPLPLVSAGGSSLLSTMIALGMVVSAKKV